MRRAAQPARALLPVLTLVSLSACGVGLLITEPEISVNVVKAGVGSGTVVSSEIGTPGGGLDCSVADLDAGDCSITFRDAGGGGILTLTASPSDGSLFAGWSGACRQDGVCTVTSRAEVVELRFDAGAPADFDLTAAFDSEPEPVVASVELAPAAATLDVLGAPGVEVVATVLDTDGAPADAPGLTWASSDPAVVAVTAGTGATVAMITAVGAGSAEVTATSANGVSGSTTVTVAGLADVVIFSDMDDGGAWMQIERGSTGGVTSTATHPASDGYEGGYRQIEHDFPGAGSINVFHALSETYDPSVDGAITSIRFSEFRRKIQPLGSGGIGATFAIMQNGSIFAHLDGEPITTDEWTYRQTDLLGRADFSAGSLDFSASGGPMTFGFIRSNTRGSVSATTVIHGVDNFRVEIRR